MYSGIPVLLPTIWAARLSAAATGSTTFRAAGYQVGSATVPVAANWSPGTNFIFTDPQGSLFIPDSSTADQTTGAPTGGGHNWAFDQGSTLCKLGDADGCH
jgi:hypothetical protein